MPPDIVATAGALAQLGVAGVVIVGFILVIQGVLRVGKLVDAERERVERERAEERKEWLRREALVVAERDAWRDRAVADGDRLDRVSKAFERLANAPAPE